MLIVSGIAGSVEEGEAMCHRAVSSGRAMELFLSNVARQGGISQAQGAQGELSLRICRGIESPARGYIASIDA